jgi:hypothetical protein
MCDGCDFADLVNDFAAAGVLPREQRRAFAEMYVDDPSGTAESLARLAERRGRPDLASRAWRTDGSLVRAYEEYAISALKLRPEEV